jgi:hypothetical protein
MTRRGFGGIVWCIVGDFNSITNIKERKGSSEVNGGSREMVEFGDFLRHLELVDVPLLGRQFTWFHPNGSSMSRLDRVLLSAE